MRKIIFVVMGVFMMVVGALWIFNLVYHEPLFIHKAIHSIISQEKILSWENVHSAIDIFGWWLLFFGGMLLMHREP